MYCLSLILFVLLNTEDTLCISTYLPMSVAFRCISKYTYRYECLFVELKYTIKQNEA